ncbi:hypothetical protein BO94DRAFT_580315 [Aspergillus sclerotioniger CBS 115572]|uniref:EthD domain-containing protein n=1 Tax=Aspergillus sclerotioniger CBS 115572 TaxID=1450535 RepID=A0A317XD68_9EURO|nr:hypothetical protein BO94DRAFT_580315 [Aspergillus sclerotioniger CBS 115572]PWY96469.1 hypothetical protein BO94DRAFT_580315 [Aspergillus sclerotioniger CBS 115572]
MSQSPDQIIRPTLFLKKREDITHEQFHHHWTTSMQQLLHHLQLYVPSLECFTNALDDPYYKEVVALDEEKFISAKSCMRTVGYEECFILNDQVENPLLTGRSSIQDCRGPWCW